MQSDYPPRSHRTEAGLVRLGRWNADHSAIDMSDAPLTRPDGSIAHVALVYSGLEEKGPDPEASAATALLSLHSIRHYATVAGLIGTAIRDAAALVHDHPTGAGGNPVSLTTRTDIPIPGHHLASLLHRQPAGAAPPSGLLGTLRVVEDDVAGYVARNQLRERVRGFVAEALERLAARPDVSSIVVNSHSNGTVIAFDVLSRLSRGITAYVSAFITAGSPLRKYADLLGWGNDAAGLSVQPWRNYWDSRDPVAEPLEPPLEWRVGQALPPDGPGLYIRYDPDTGDEISVPVKDILVDNVAGVQEGGGLPAHNYWDNDEFCESIAELLDRPAQ